MGQIPNIGTVRTVHTVLFYDPLLYDRDWITVYERNDRVVCCECGCNLSRKVVQQQIEFTNSKFLYRIKSLELHELRNPVILLLTAELLNRWFWEFIERIGSVFQNNTYLVVLKINSFQSSRTNHWGAIIQQR